MYRTSSDGSQRNLWQDYLHTFDEEERLKRVRAIAAGNHPLAQKRRALAIYGYQHLKVRGGYSPLEAAPATHIHAAFGRIRDGLEANITSIQNQRAMLLPQVAQLEPEQLTGAESLQALLVAEAYIHQHQPRDDLLEHLNERIAIMAEGQGIPMPPPPEPNL